MVKWGLFWAESYFEEKSGERNNMASQTLRCKLYLISQAWAGSSMASSSGGIWRPCSDLWWKLGGNMTPAACVFCVAVRISAFFSQVGSEESLPSWLAEHQSSEGLTLHKLLSQAETVTPSLTLHHNSRFTLGYASLEFVKLETKFS